MLGLTDVVLTDGRFWDAFFTVNKRPRSVEKAKASSGPVDLRERFFDAVLSTLLVTMAIGSRLCLFRHFWTCQRLVDRQKACPKQEYVTVP